MYSGELPNFWVKDWIDVQLYGKQRLTKSEIERCEHFYRERLYLYNNDIIETDELQDLLKVTTDTIIKRDIKFVVLDNLMTALESDYNETLYRKQSNFVGQLAKLAKALQIVVVLIAHPRKTPNTSRYEFDNDDVSGSADITNRVDTVINYEKTKDSSATENQRVMKVTKNRLWGYTGEFNVWYSDDSRRTSEVEGNYYKNYLGDNEDEWQQDPDLNDIPF
jgi:twinkle protein